MFGEISPRKKARAPFISVEEALEETRRGHMIILMDDEQRENEGDLCMAAEKATPEAVNFMAKFGRGLICLPMSAERIDRLGLNMMIGDNQAPLGTAFTTSITARRASGSGISAQDRATTILQAVREDATAASFITPGYVYPLRARDGGVLVRTGQTEGAVDLARLAGLKPAGVICEILKDDGTMARRDDLVEFAQVHDLKIVTVADIIEYRLRNETMVQRIAEAKLPTAYGEFTAIVYRNLVDFTEHLVLVMGNIDPTRPILVRAHREYLPGDVFGLSQRNTRKLLRAAMEKNRGGRRGRTALRQARGEHDRGRTSTAGARRKGADHAGEPARRGVPRLRHRRADHPRPRRTQNDRAVGHAAAAGQSSRLWTGNRRQRSALDQRQAQHRSKVNR